MRSSSSGASKSSRRSFPEIFKGIISMISPLWRCDGLVWVGKRTINTLVLTHQEDFVNATKIKSSREFRLRKEADHTGRCPWISLMRASELMGQLRTSVSWCQHVEARIMTNRFSSAKTIKRIKVSISVNDMQKTARCDTRPATFFLRSRKDSWFIVPWKGLTSAV